MRVGLVLVSHSAKLAEGLAEVAAQMAPEVQLCPAGGTDDGGIGTSLEKVLSAVDSAESGAGVVILADLGSAIMTAESALEFLGEPENIQLARAALVEGAVAAAVAAQSGAPLAEVQAAAESALDVQSGSGPSTPHGGGAPDSPVETIDVELVNPLGLHARPAATLAAALGAMDVDIEINGVDGQSVMMLMTLGAGKGTTLHVEASGPDAGRAVELVRSEVQAGFGEM